MRSTLRSGSRVAQQPAASCAVPHGSVDSVCVDDGMAWTMMAAAHRKNIGENSLDLPVAPLALLAWSLHILGSIRLESGVSAGFALIFLKNIHTTKATTF